MIRMKNLREMILITLMFVSNLYNLADGESLMGGHLDNKIKSTPKIENHPDESSLHYRIANVPFAFNGGQPFSLEKDPVTGQINFDKAPPLKALNYTNSFDKNGNGDGDDDSNDDDKLLTEQNENNVDDTELLSSSLSPLPSSEETNPNEINPYLPSFHDFLNLPVHYSDHEKYTSDKYPLISNSYANTKFQGGATGHKPYTINHKNYYGGKASTSYSYSMTRTPFVPNIFTSKHTTVTRPVTSSTSTTTTSSTTTTTWRPKTTSTSTTTTTPSTTTRRITTTTTKIPSTTTARSTTPSSTHRTTVTSTLRPTTQVVTTWKPHKFDHFSIDYDDDVMLPIEKMQQNPEVIADQFFESDGSDYDENYRDMEYLSSSTAAVVPSSSSTVSSKAPAPVTTVTEPSSTLTPKTSMPIDYEQPENVTSINNSNFNDNISNNNKSPSLNGMTKPVQEAINTNGFNSNAGSVGGFNNNVNNINSKYPPYLSGLVVESASNIIIPPDQDTISFVLGNKQNVDGSYYAHGSAIPESPYGDINPMSNTGKITFDDDNNRNSNNQNHPLINNVSPSYSKLPADHFEPPSVQQDSEQNWWNVNDPSHLDKQDKVNVVGAGYKVVFPSASDGFHLSSSTTTEIPSTSSTTIPPPVTTVRPGENLSTLAEILTPPPMEKHDRPAARPNYYYHNHHNYHHHHHHHKPAEIPLRVQRPTGPSSSGYKIRPMDVNLPNILPQFRPNVIPSQRRGSEGTLIGPGPNNVKYGNRSPVRGAPSLPPHHIPSRRPPMTHLHRLSPPPPVHTLKLPIPAALVSTGPNPDFHGPIFHQKDIPHRRNVPENEVKLDERNRITPVPQILKSRLNDDEEKLSGEAPITPPQPPIFPKRKNGNSSVTTLQMIKQYEAMDVEKDKKVEDKIGEKENEEKVEMESDDMSLVDRRVDEAPVYVVYPVKTSMDILPNSEDLDDKGLIDESVVIGVHGSQRPLPPDTLNTQEDGFDNDEEEKVIVPAQIPVKASDFPYPLERPNPADLSLFMSQEKPLLIPNKHHQQQQQAKDNNSFKTDEDNRDSSINVIPYLQDHQPFAMKPHIISTTLQLNPSALSSASTSTPIAYVYTPTIKVPMKIPSELHETNPILPSQQPSSSSSSAPSPQSFMAPFLPSLSAETPSKNGWSVVTGNPFYREPEASDRKDTFDDNPESVSENVREDSVDNKSNNSSSSSSSNSSDSISNSNNSNVNSSINSNSKNTMKINDSNDNNENKNKNDEFDLTNFQPQYHGGFQPMGYPINIDDQQEQLPKNLDQNT